MGALYSAVLFSGVSNLMMVMSVIYEERVVYYREKAAGMYSPLAFAVAQVRQSRRACIVPWKHAWTHCPIIY